MCVCVSRWIECPWVLRWIYIYIYLCSSSSRVEIANIYMVAQCAITLRSQAPSPYVETQKAHKIGIHSLFRLIERLISAAWLTFRTFIQGYVYTVLILFHLYFVSDKMCAEYIITSLRKHRFFITFKHKIGTSNNYIALVNTKITKINTYE